MKLNNNNPASSAATGTQKCTSVSTLVHLLELTFGSACSISPPGKRKMPAMFCPRIVNDVS